MALDVAQSKQNQRKMWAAGDYPDLARTVERAAEALVARCDVRPGHELLDVATGSGNAAIVAARLGARVTGLDLTPELVDLFEADNQATDGTMRVPAEYLITIARPPE
jgi:cyclopropane fatty-acyl-phospholipid synthase-like methyltransferase